MKVNLKWSDMPPKQGEVYRIARDLHSRDKQVSPREIAKITENNDNPSTKEIRRVESVQTILKKKGLWGFAPANGGRPVLKTLLGDIPLGKPAARQAPKLPYCNLHQSEEDSVHDFGIKVLEEFQKLSRNAQVKVWSVISDLLDRTMKGPQ